MGKKRRLNRFISKWIKSDLPEEDRSTVLLLGVTRIATSPAPTRRPCSPTLIPRPQHANGGRVVVVRRNSSRKRDGRHCCQVPSISVVSPPGGDKANRAATRCPDLRGITPTASKGFSHEGIRPPSVMERSVDSIGTCSLDVEASVCDVSDWSEASSVATLRSANLLTPSTPSPHLPSYLSLACTVNGYSTTTNYDPIRLARSRDVSPHRIDNDLTPNRSYSVQNNLLSPPNLVPLPSRSKTSNAMGENTLTQHHHHREFYTSAKTVSFVTKESRFASSFDTIDSCLENGHRAVHAKCVTSISETSIKKEFSNGTETKSFIQQRVERLYGPGALAQGFFVSKRQKNRLSESESEDRNAERHPEDEREEPSMKQSASSPTLPVLRHLRPEFRAQLPIVSTRKGSEGAVQKSVTVPELKEEVEANGHSGGEEDVRAKLEDVANGHAELAVKDESGVKDGRYFLKVLEGQTERLSRLAARVEAEIATPDLSEEVIGKLRSASGKARLLVSQKMQQFKGLCTNNINQSVGEAFPTTDEDLQGFWDMVMLQVDQIDALFAEIDALRNNDWKEVAKTEVVGAPTKVKKAVPRPRPTSAANEEARKQREAQRRKMIEERRRAMKSAQKQQAGSIEIFVPESS